MLSSKTLSRAAVALRRADLLRAVAPLVAVRDEPGGGFRLRNENMGKCTELVVGGLGKALAERVYSRGPGFINDSGPSTVGLGLRVHMHVFHIVECLTFGAVCQCRARFKHPSKANKGAKAILSRLNTMGLTPVASELLLLAPAWNLATRADLVCADSDGEFVLVSLKTGAGSTRTTGRLLRGPTGMDAVSDTQRARHQVQLLSEFVLLGDAGVSVARAQIMYVETGSLDPRCVIANAANWWWEKTDLQSEFKAFMCSN